jgi:GT2 family glycosyltransferase
VTTEESSGKVSIIIPTISAPCIWCCLTHVFLTTGSKREVIVVIDQPSEQRLKLLARFGVTVIANRDRVGAPRAFNQGMKVASRPYVVVMNDDILPMTDWLTPMVEALEKHPEFGMVSPRVIRPWNEDKVWFAALGEGAMMSREMIEKVGYFDEDPDYAAQCTDADYYARAMAAGYRFRGIPTSMIIHNCGQTIGPMLTDDYCNRVAAKIAAKYGDLGDQHLLPEYLGEEEKERVLA